MEIGKISDGIYSFKGCKCAECDFRFGCYTSQSACCPLKAVRLVEERTSTHEYYIETNTNLGKFDSSLLYQISKELHRTWSEQNAKN